MQTDIPTIQVISQIPFSLFQETVKASRDNLQPTCFGILKFSLVPPGCDKLPVKLLDRERGVAVVCGDIRIDLPDRWIRRDESASNVECDCLCSNAFHDMSPCFARE